MPLRRMKLRRYARGMVRCTLFALVVFGAVVLVGVVASELIKFPSWQSLDRATQLRLVALVLDIAVTIAAAGLVLVVSLRVLGTMDELRDALRGGRFYRPGHALPAPSTARPSPTGGIEPDV